MNTKRVKITAIDFRKKFGLCKIRVNKTTSAAIQEKFFEVGIDWRASGYKPLYLKDKYLYISNGHLYSGNDAKYFRAANAKEYKAQTILRCDIDTMCPFACNDIVLGREKDYVWCIDTFKYYNPDEKYRPYMCTHKAYYECLPYNNETMHLLGIRKNFKKR